MLMGGHFPDAAKIAYDAFEIFQPAVDKALAEMATSLYAGEWASEDKNSSASIAVSKGTLYIDRLIANGTDILAKFSAPHRVALRSMQRNEDFR